MIRTAVIAALVFAALVSSAEAEDVCTTTGIMQCTAMACFSCETGKDGVKYCQPGGNCNTCTGGDWQCRRDDGTTYSKPLLDSKQGLTPAGPNRR